MEKFDSNFDKTVISNISSDNYEIPHKSFQLYGLLFDKDNGFYRLDRSVIKKCKNKCLDYLNLHTSGGRISFSTNSKYITLNVTYKKLEIISHVPISTSAGFVLKEIYKDGKEILISTFVPGPKDNKGFRCSSKELDDKSIHDYIIYFPLYNGIKSLSIELCKNATLINKGTIYRKRKPILYYGSSITQGASASRSDNSYPALISEALKVDFINLGFSGNCLGNLPIQKALKDIDCSAFIYAYDYNAPNAKFLSMNHEQLFKEFRKKNKNVPVIFVSRINGFNGLDEANTRKKIIKKTYQSAINSGDKNVYFVDGSKIYPKAIRERCSMDGCHPNDLGFYYIARRLTKLLRKIIN